MNTEAVRDAAIQLDILLHEYAPSNETASALLRTLQPILDEAKAGRVQQPMDRQSIPGGRTFDETDARDLPGLENAFARFRTEMSGGESAAQKLFRERHGISR